MAKKNDTIINEQSEGLIKDKSYNPLLNALRENDKRNLFKTNVVTAFHKTGFAVFDHYFGAVVNIHDKDGKFIKQEPRVGQAAGTFNLIIANTGAGKAQPVSTKIPTPDGYKLMGDLQIGDKVFDENGKPTNVIGVFPQGIKDIYEITFSDGRKALCCKEHLWHVITYTHRGEKHSVISLEEMMKDYKHFDDPNNKFRKYRIPTLTGPVEYNHRDVPIHPYVLGALIGNGCLKEKQLSISDATGEVATYIARLINAIPNRSSANNYTCVFHDKGTLAKISTSDFFADLPEMIGTESFNKHIPDIYLYNDIETRMQLLQGLMDTDGSISYDNGRFHVRYSSCSKVLLLQIKELIQSLGFNANITIDKRIEKYRNGFHATLNMLVPNSFKPNMFAVTVKSLKAMAAINYPIRRNYDALTITDIKFSHKEEAKCILVDSPNHLYVTENFIITHNTTFASQVAANIMRQYPYSNVIHFDCEERFDVSRCETITKLPARYFEEDRYMIKTGAVGLDVIQEMIVKSYTAKMKIGEELMVDTGYTDEFGKPVRVFQPTIVIIDSMTTVIDKTFNVDNAKEASEAEKMRSNTDGARDSKTLKGFFKDILPLCKEANIIIYGINHINTNMSMNAFTPVAKQQNYLKQDESIPGGKSMLYYPFNIIKMVAKPADDFTEEADGFSGHIVMFEPIKSSSNQSGNNSKGISFEMVFAHKYGFDALRTLIHYGRQNGIIEGNKTRMRFKDDNTFTFTWKNINQEAKEKPIYECIRKYIIPVLEEHLPYIEPDEIEFDDNIFNY